MKNLLRPALLLLLLAFACVTGAQPTFFSTRLVVGDRSQAALASAASKALGQVFIKVSGDEQVAALPLVQEAIDNARNMMSLYSYEESDGTLDLLIEFDEGVVKNVLRDAGATYWSESRPPVLVWLVVDEPSSRRFATASEDSDLVHGLAEGFRERGIIMRAPLLDLEDSAALSPEMVWQKVAPRIQEASVRYGTPHILVGRYVKLTSGLQLTDWLYISGTEQRQIQDQSNELEPLLSVAVDMVVDAMAGQYAVKLDTLTSSERLSVAINGVTSFDDYRAVIAIFEGISVLSGVRVFAVNGDQLRLSMGGVSSADALSRLLPQRSGLAIAGEPLGRELNLDWERAY